MPWLKLIHVSKRDLRLLMLDACQLYITSYDLFGFYDQYNYG